jgi:hypothetical protein
MQRVFDSKLNERILTGEVSIGEVIIANMSSRAGV